MKNIDSAKKAMQQKAQSATAQKQAPQGITRKEIVIRITGASAETLIPIGVQDLYEYFIPKRLEVSMDDIYVEVHNGIQIQISQGTNTPRNPYISSSMTPASFSSGGGGAGGIISQAEYERRKLQYENQAQKDVTQIWSRNSTQF